MADEHAIICPSCGKAWDASWGLSANADGRLLCDSCGGEIPIPVAEPDDFVGDSTTYIADPPTVIDPPRQVQPIDDATIESLLPDSHYVPQKTIKKGGMGEIVLCVEQNTHRRVAMKRMLPTTAKHPRQRARFVEEAQVTAQLEHPNIVPVHELGRDSSGAIYFTMKLVKGRSLSEIIAGLRSGEETHSLVELLQIFLKVCDGVAFAHSRGVVHRDLKPGNIMVGDFGEVLVMDWGIARILAQRDRTGDQTVHTDRQETDAPGLHTMAGSMMGSPSYMPPEQATGQIDKIDRRSDIYSLGAILYAILTLRRPVTGKTNESILTKVVRGDIRKPEDRAPQRDIPRELSAVAMKCMAKYRSGRYASVPQLQRDVRLHLEGRSVTADPDSFARALVKFFKRNKGIGVAMSAAAVLLTAIASVAFMRVSNERDSALASERKAVAAQKLQRETALASSERFAMQAIRAAETGRTEEAHRRVVDAETVAIDSPWGPYARGMLARIDNSYAEAADLFNKALAIDPEHYRSRSALSETLLKMGDLNQAGRMLADAGRAKDWRALLRAGQTLFEAGRWSESQTLFKRAVEIMEQANDATTGVRLATAKDVQEKIDKAQKIIDLARAKSACDGFADTIRDLSPDQQIPLVRDKFEEVNGPGAELLEIEVFDGQWIKASVSNKTRFLEPLEGLPLQHLECSWSKVDDLSPLRVMPLRRLSCRNTPVRSLAPLVESMTLTDLNCNGTRVRSLEPLKGMPLKDLDIGLTRVTDLGPLKGMPLESLNLQGTKVRDLEPLKGMGLIRLECSQSDIVDISPLADMPLVVLSLGRTRVFDLSPLKDLPLRDLDISQTRAAELSLLTGMKLRKLACGDTEINDLEPLKGMKLTVLACGKTEIDDISVLKGMPLTRFDCHHTKISDLSPLSGAPLRELVMHNTKVTDLTPLKGMKLASIIFTPGKITKGLEVVREMKTIEWLGLKSRFSSERIDPVEFWNRYDEGEFE